MKKYYYVDSLNATQGPVSLSDLERLHMEKIITSQTQVNEVGDENWYPFYQIDTKKPVLETPSTWAQQPARSVRLASQPSGTSTSSQAPTFQKRRWYNVEEGIQKNPLRLYVYLKVLYYIHFAVTLTLLILNIIDKEILSDIISTDEIFALWLMTFFLWGFAELLKVIHTAAYSIDRIRIKLESD